MEWVDVGHARALRQGGTRVEIEGREVAVFRIGDEFYALGDRCSHAEASLAEGEVFDYEVECPLHGAGFDVRTGRELSLPATRPVPTYRVRVAGERVQVALEEGE